MKITKMMLGVFQPQTVNYLAKVESNLIFHGVIKESQENVLVQNALCFHNFRNLIDFLIIIIKVLARDYA